jgi:hypothetical protein
MRPRTTASDATARDCAPDAQGMKNPRCELHTGGCDASADQVAATAVGIAFSAFATFFLPFALAFVAIVATPEEFGKVIQSETDKWEKVVKFADAKVE